jgi:hypothetical protein
VWTHIRIEDAEKCAKPEPRREGTAVVDGECPRCGSLVHTEAECDDDPLDDANGYTRSDLLFGGNW